MEAPSPSTAIPSQAVGGDSLRSGLAQRGLNIEAERMTQLQEALAKKRSQMIAQRQQDFRGGLQEAMLGGFAGELPTEMGEKDKGITSEGDEMLAQGAQMAREAAMAERLQSLKQMARIKADQMLESKEGQEAKEKIQKEFRKAAKSAIRRGVEYALEAICGSVDTASVGVSTIITVLIHAFTLTDLNIQMIYGHYIAKGKSILFPALDWSPLRIPLPVIFLHAALVLFDIFLVLVIGTLLLALLIIMFLPQIIAMAGILGVYKFATDPTFRSIISNIIVGS